MIKRVIYCSRHGWEQLSHQRLQIYQAGTPTNCYPLFEQLTKDTLDIEKIRLLVADLSGHFALIIEGSNFWLACSDHCRSSPIFFHTESVSNDAHMLRSIKNLNTPNKRAMRDASMAGFVTGPNTLFAELNQLEAGTLALWQTGQTEPLVYKHTTYKPVAIRNIHQKSLADDLMSVLDNTAITTINAAKGKPIWVGLSGGLDSRLLLAKFVEHGCPDLHAFTYGPRGSDEIAIAQRVARQLKVDWVYQSNSPRIMKTFFSHTERKQYWTFCDGLSAVPTFQDFLPLKMLIEKGRIPSDATIVNGQTGDFISGGHIPEPLMTNKVHFEVLCDAIIKKHFSLWNSLKKPSRVHILREELGKRFDCQPQTILERDEAIAFYEQFEYEERQAKYVINGQRNYEFLDLSWSLPLWSAEVVQFWRDVPTKQKYKQALYRSALENWDYRGIFTGIRTTVSHWPGIAKAVLVPSRLLRLLFGTQTRDAYLKRMLYFGLYRDQYAPYGYIEFLRNASQLRNPVSLLSRTWLKELGLNTNY